MFAHLGWSGGAVETNAVNSECTDGGKGGTDFAAEKHRAGGFDCDRNQKCNLTTGFAHRSLRADDCALCLQEILNGLNQNCVDSTVNQSPGGILVGIAQNAELFVSKRRKFCARAERAQNPARSRFGLKLICNFAGNVCTSSGKFVNSLDNRVFGKVCKVCAEGVGFDSVCPGFEILGMNRSDQFWSGDI